MACSKVSLGGACAQALPGKAKAAPAIAVVRVSFNFTMDCLGQVPGGSWSTTPNRSVQERMFSSERRPRNISP